ncbi:threonine--tRNA ligase [Candidatus Woesebacteria bacterium RIFCSPLOWO2_01_FULL_37_19]|uniref:Threonine--tRNA ligase n=1 Tax=Candidatus Woesebacteria bacterium RIFCSPLOWO2_01_FULL_37_19 TaxID=1802514 RepID=A0A1F8BAS7_9BACT|nr:MAG: threonine--tRNA ligase [Candidatus Woesebacteria bacterium RIFCSPLOWO2_01_FULL_37_19]
MDRNYLDNLRHSTAHLMAAAVMEIWPLTKRAIGPSIEDGFYFDFDFGGTKVTEDDFPKIEAKMREILPSWKTFERKLLSAASAKKEYPENSYKHEMIDEFSGNGKKKVSFFKSGNYWDLCRGGHVEHPNKELNHFKLLSVAGAYWRGDEKNPMLTRIYATAWPTQKELDDHLNRIEEAKKRDHKKLGPLLELFMFHETAPGMPYWLPKGVILYNELVNFWRAEHKNRGYQEIVSPILNKKELYITSGHYDHYWSEMFVAKTEDEGEYGVKAMNCPNAHVVYGSKIRSYRDLPLRLSDTDTLHRYEMSGVLNGLFRVREFRQDDAHIYVSEDQIESEYKEVFSIVKKFYEIFDLKYSFRLGTRNPQNYMGDIPTWNKAEKTLEKILKESGVDYTILDGDGAFYGPKVDILMKDAIGRSWQMGTVQLDFQQPRRFNLVYTDSDGSKKTPIAIHRVVYGSLERFIGILIEHFTGAFPVWLSPAQVKILLITDRNTKYAKEISEELTNENIRTTIDDRNETLQAKIRDAQLEKVNYMLIVGDKEESSKKISVRLRSGKDTGQMSLEDFIKNIKKEIEEKKIN